MAQSNMILRIAEDTPRYHNSIEVAKLDQNLGTNPDIIKVIPPHQNPIHSTGEKGVVPQS